MGRIVVGMDGSQNARAALAWAVDEAKRRESRLEVVMAWHPPYPAGSWEMPMPVDLDAVERSRRGELDRLIALVDDGDLIEPIEGVLVNGSAAHALLDAAKGAELLVVGSRGHGGFVGLLLGSVSHQVASHSPCPVVIVPSSENDENSTG